MTTKITSTSTRETVGVYNSERTVLVTLGPDDSITLRSKGLYTGFKVSIAALLAFAEKQADRKPGVTTFKLARTVKSKDDAVPPVPTADDYATPISVDGIPYTNPTRFAMSVGLASQGVVEVVKRHGAQHPFTKADFAGCQTQAEMISELIL